MTPIGLQQALPCPGMDQIGTMGFFDGAFQLAMPLMHDQPLMGSSPSPIRALTGKPQPGVAPTAPAAMRGTLQAAG